VDSARVAAARADLGPDETLDRLAGDWWVFQLRRGHRYSTDDVLVSWTAARADPDAGRLLDLGAGIGSIGLMTLRLLGPEARLTSVERLGVSVGLARRSVALNGIADRVELRHGDLRDPAVLGSEERFDLVTANPPYAPPHRGWVPRHPQRGAARFELWGDVFDYCRVAARHIGSEGRFCFSFPCRDPRATRAIEDAGLRPISAQPVVFRQGRSPHIAVYVCALAGSLRELPELCVRDPDGQRTPEYLAVLRDVGIVA
jgi:tRNA1Val (adenine37-N6)-methyltransferase